MTQQTKVSNEDLEYKDIMRIPLEEKVTIQKAGLAHLLQSSRSQTKHMLEMGKLIADLVEYVHELEGRLRTLNHPEYIYSDKKRVD